MKERYFTFENTDNMAKLLLSELQEYGAGKNISLLPEKSALLVLDMQRFFTDKSSHAFIPSSEAVIPRIKALINLYTDANLPVIFTRHINTDVDAGLMKRWWRDVIQEDNPMSEIMPELITSNSHIIKKSQYDAFYKTDLEEYLTKNKIDQLVVTGVMTHLCCETTIRSTFVRGFETFFPIDATATYNFEFHRSAFINLSHGFAVPVLVKDIELSMVHLCGNIK